MAGITTVISSMATRQILAELAAAFGKQTGNEVQLESAGGVDVTRRLRANERFDLVVLAADALKALADDGFVMDSTARVFALSPTAVAVPAGIPTPSPCDEAAIKALVYRAARIGVSTGPSGTNIRKVLMGWGMLDTPSRQIVLAPPGVPVARLLATGEADVGFQQLSELLGEPGIAIVGTVPETVQPMTAFAVGIARSTSDVAHAQALLAFLVSEAGTSAKRRHGMEPEGWVSGNLRADSGLASKELS